MNNINYNSDFLCSYRLLDEDYYRNLCYQIQLLQAFNMNKYDEFILQKNMEQLFSFLKDNNEIKELIAILEKSLISLQFMLLNTPENMKAFFYFQILFSYDYFDIFHKCLSKYFEDIKKKNILKHDYFEELKTFVNNNL